MTLNYSFSIEFYCTNKIFGSGPVNFKALGPCENATKEAKNSPTYGHIEDHCIIKAVEDLLNQSKVM